MAVVVTATHTCYLLKRDKYIPVDMMPYPRPDNIMDYFVYRTNAMSTFIRKFDNGDYPDLIKF